MDKDHSSLVFGSGLSSGTLCQKSSLTFAEAISRWTARHPERKELPKIELAINHYSNCGQANFRALLLTEGSPTWPSNKRSVFRNYDFVFASTSSDPGVICVPWFNKPDIEGPSAIGALSRAPRFTVLAADKASTVFGELYSLRRKVIRRNLCQIDLFGALWDANFSRRLKVIVGELISSIRASARFDVSGIFSYLFIRIASQGTVEHKSQALGLNKFSLVIENNLEIRTEKLYDAIEGGTVPVYVGPDCHDGIPEDLFIKSEPNMAAIELAMRRVLEIDLVAWGHRRDEWLKSESYLASDEARFGSFLEKLVTMAESKASNG